MGFITKGFDLFYKRLGPTGSASADPHAWYGYLPLDWYDKDISGTIDVSSSFLNFPTDDLTTTYATTRDTTFNTTYKALPWSSHACDMLWNVTVPSWSFVDTTVSQANYYPPNTSKNVTYRTWSVNTLMSKSFYSESLDGALRGVRFYSVTSSWKIIDPKFIYDGGGSGSASFSYVQDVQGETSHPSYVGARYDLLAPDSSSLVSYDITYPTASNNSTCSFDGQYFDQGGGAGITRTLVSQSLVTMSLYANSSTGPAILGLTRALKQRRLFFPTPYSGSGTTLGTDYWFKANTGYNVKDVFTENGGIYNVQLTIKKSPVAYDYYPDSNTFLSVFIHNITPNVGSATDRVAGADGWYPPENNIVRIGNGYDTAPVMSFYDVQTGYQVEKFNFNVIQYGYPAQFCIEASGSLTDNAYFGIIVDDVQVCKIGVTTDSRFIKPTTINAGITLQKAKDTIGGGTE